LLLQTLGRQHSGKYTNGTPGAALVGRISWARPQFGRSRRAALFYQQGLNSRIILNPQDRLKAVFLFVLQQ
jgi:hypothetical protein